MSNEALDAALAEYEAVGARYVAALEEKGLVFAEEGAGERRRAELRAQLAARGVAVRNAGASLSAGHLSPACVECTGNRGSETFSTTFKCHRDCYFCFNHNQPDYEKFFREGCPWEEGVDRAAAENGALACVGLTGGEPLLQLDEALIDAMHRAGFEIAIETNGTIAVPPGIDWVCVSPKAGAKLVVRQGDEIKVVIPQENQNLADYERLAFSHFYVQPMDGANRQQNVRIAIATCLANPKWKLGLQTHKFLQIP